MLPTKSLKNTMTILIQLLKELTLSGHGNIFISALLFFFFFYLFPPQEKKNRRWQFKFSWSCRFQILSRVKHEMYCNLSKVNNIGFRWRLQSRRQERKRKKQGIFLGVIFMQSIKSANCFLPISCWASHHDDRKWLTGMLFSLIMIIAIKFTVLDIHHYSVNILAKIAIYKEIIVYRVFLCQDIE